MNNSSFKDKNIKYSSFCNNILNKSLIVYGTLDSRHQDKLKEFEKKEKNILKLQNKLEKLREELKLFNDIDPNNYSFDDINKKATIKNNIEDIEEEIQSLQNMEEELDYFYKNSDILDKYYEINHHDESDISSNILDFFNMNNNKKKKSLDKSILFNNYLKRTNQIELNQKKKCNNRICSRCNIEKILHLQEGLLTCTNCGETEFILIDSDKPNYKDPVIENKASGYKRMNHFSELLNQFQGKESTEIPNQVFEMIIQELKKLRIDDLSTLNNPTLRAILKKLNLNSYYEHIPYIINKLNGLPSPSLTRELEDKLRQMFREIQEPFMLFKPPDRKNFLNNNYVFHKLFELLEQDNFLPYFPYLKSREKLQEHDEIFEKICKYNNWSFIRSL